jgi:enoyl-[acyl-carrier protein] reductase I
MHNVTEAADPLPKVWNPESRVGDMLRGRRGLVVGIANEYSIAFGCAAKLHAFGAELAVTYLNEKAERYVRPLAEQIQAGLILPLDVEQPGQLEAVFERIGSEWGKLDFVIHSIAFAPRGDLHARLADCSLAGFQQAMRVSCYSFIEMARLAGR